MQALSLIPSVNAFAVSNCAVAKCRFVIRHRPCQNGRIAFFANLTGTYQIFTVKADGSDLFRVTNLPPSNDGFRFRSRLFTRWTADRLSS
jgi:hypothetical protein